MVDRNGPEPYLTDGPYAESKEYCLSSSRYEYRFGHRVLPDDEIPTEVQVPAEERRRVRRRRTQYLARH